MYIVVVYRIFLTPELGLAFIGEEMMIEIRWTLQL